MKITDTIIQGDSLAVLKELPDECVDCVITSPPYWGLRDYGVDGQLGLERTLEEYVGKMVEIFREVRRVLKNTGSCFVNLGDTYGTGSGVDENRVHAKQGTLKGWINGREKVPGYQYSLLMIPEKFAISMIDGGWKLRNKIIWHKKNAMPSSVVNRWSNKYEFVYFFVKDKEYYFDLDSVRVPYETEEKRPMGIIRQREYGYNTKQGTKRREMKENSRTFNKRRPPANTGEYKRNPKGKNPGDVWTLTLQPHPERHIAMFPEKLISPLVKAASPEGGLVLDPFIGSGTTAVVAKKLGRHYLGIELNPDYIEIAEKRIERECPLTLY